MPFSPKTILITGASRGLGLEFVKQILKLPSAPEILIAACRNPDKATALQEIAKGNPSLKIVKLDVGKDDDIDSAFRETKAILGDRGLNLLISNAAVFAQDEGLDWLDTSLCELRDISRQRLNSHYDVNCTGPILVVQKFLPLLEKAATGGDPKALNCSKSAVVTITTSLASQEETFKGDGVISVYHYRCSKSALNMATILMSRELSSLGILVTALHPGWVKTDMGGQVAPLTPQESVSSLLNVMAGAGPDYQGKLVGYNGKVLPF